MSFANLKRNRTDVASLLAQADPSQGTQDKSKYVDDRMWKPTRDKAGNGYAVVRFLPGLNGDVPFVRYWDHGFKGPTGQWYIEKSLTSIGQQDPVSEANSELWATEIKENQDLVRERKRRLKYVSNILVVSDPANPQNEGQVFMYQYGKKIFDKIMDQMQPQFQDEEPMNPFDFWEGANFKLKIQQVSGYPNYDKSEFASQGALSEDDAELEAIYDKMYDLNEWIDPANYKTYDELKARFLIVEGREPAPRSVQQVAELEQVREPAPMRSTPPAEAPSVSTDDEDALSYFAQLAAED
jgi:hypothetical protein